MTPRRSLLWGYLFAGGAALSYASSQNLAKLVVRQWATPMVAATFTLGFGALFLAVFLAPSLPGEVSRLRNNFRGFFLFAVAGVVAALSVIATYTALSLSPVVMVSPLTSTYPLVALLVTRLFLHRLERVGRRVALGAFLVVSGVVLITLAPALNG